MSYTNYLEHASLNLMFGATAFTPSGTLYIGLSLSAPNEDGTNFGEPQASSGYQRASIANLKASTSGWSTAEQVNTSGEVHNMGTISFGTASGNWGTVTHFGIWDQQASGAGNRLVDSPLVLQKTPTSGDIVTFASGALSIRMD